MYDQNLRTRMATMPPQQLKQFAMMHKDDPFVVSMAVDIDNTRKAAQRQQAMQAVQQPQPKVVDQELAAIGQPVMPPQGMPQPQPEQQPVAPQAQAGLPQLPAQNIAHMADGGIAGYEEGYAGGGQPTFDATPYLQNQNVQRFLAYINTYEGAPQPNQMVGYRQFDDLSRHPNKAVKFNKKGDKSTAAGSYQLLNRTWKAEAKRQGLDDFSLENQQRAAIGVLKDTGALNDIVRGNFDAAKAKAAKAWASIPGSTIGAATGQHARVKPQAEQYLAAAKQATQPVMAEAGTRQAPRTPEMLALQQAAIRRREMAEAVPLTAARAGETTVAQPNSAPTRMQQLRAIDLGISPKEVVELEKKEAAQAAEAYKNRSGIERLPKDVRDVLGMPEAAASFLSGAVAPATALLPAALSQFTDKPLTYNQAMDSVTYAPRLNVSKDSLSELYRAVDDFKIPAYIPGIGAPRRAPAKGQAARTAALATEAELAAAKNKTSALRLTGPEPVAAPKADFAADVAAAARARVPKTPLMQEIEQARALEQGRKEFSVDPNTTALGDEALARRRAVEQAQADLKAKAANERVPGLAEKPAEKLTPEQGLEADKARIAELEQKLLGDQTRASDLGYEDFRAREALRAQKEAGVRYDVGRQLAGGASGAATRGPGEVEPYAAYSDEPGYDFITPDSATKGEVPIEERSRMAMPEKKTGGFTDEDYQMMGLNLLASPGGMAGNGLSQLGQNIGRAGLATLQSKKTREQQELDKLYKQAHGEYFKQMGKKAGAEADYFENLKSEDVRRIKVLDAVSESMKSWRTANYGATPQEEQAEANRLFALYSQQIGLTPNTAGATTSGITVPQGVKITKG